MIPAEYLPGIKGKQVKTLASILKNGMPMEKCLLAFYTKVFSERQNSN
jgi:hypothetical protein